MEGWGGDNLICVDCGLHFEHRTKYIKHISNHKEKTISCPSCDAMFRFKDKLRKHSRVRFDLFPVFRLKAYCLILQVEGWGGESLICMECGRHFQHRIKYINHIRKHKERTIPCPSCDAMFNERNKLRKHIRVRTSL